MAKGSVLVVGSLNMDLVVQVDEMPKIGETVFGHGFHTVLGGKGANQAVAAARLGANVAMIGCIGRDDFGEKMLSALAKENVAVTGIRIVEGSPTGTALIAVDQRGNNWVIVVSGANSLLGKEDIDANVHLFRSCDVVVLQLEIPLATVEYAIRTAKGFGKKVILNLAPMNRLDMSAIQSIDYLILNELEAKGLMNLQTTDAGRLTAALSSLPCEHVILTLGEKGGVYISKGKYFHFDAHQVKAVDTTGAGDCFVGAFASQIAQGRNAEDAIRFANKAAAIAVTRLGAQSSLPVEEDVRNFEEASGGNR